MFEPHNHKVKVKGESGPDIESLIVQGGEKYRYRQFLELLLIQHAEKQLAPAGNKVENLGITTDASE